MILDALVPTGYSVRPSGGNLYDRHVLAGLAAAGWQVSVHEVDSATEVDRVLGGLPHQSLVLADSLVASMGASMLLDSPATVVPLMHMLFGGPLEHVLLSQAPAVITTSTWTRAVVVAEHAVDPRRVHVAAPGVDPAARSPGTGTGADLLCVAALTPAKGHDVWLAALATLTDLTWRCTLVGALEDATWVDSLRKQAADFGIGDRVHITGELVGQPLQEAWSRADLLVVPSRTETFAMVVTEALARGLPVVASAVGGVPEALGELEDGTRPGMLVRPGDPRPLARALRRWLEDEPLRIWLRRSAAARVCRLHRWSRTSDLVARALEAAR